MKTISTRARILDDGTMTLKVPTDVPPGEHDVVIVIDTTPAPQKTTEPLRFSAYPVGLVDNDFTFRRADLYDDNGR